MNNINIIPRPHNMKYSEGTLKIDKHIRFFSKSNIKDNCKRLIEEVFANKNLTVEHTEDESKANLIVKLDLVYDNEDYYKLNINQENVIVNATVYRGLVNAITTLHQIVMQTDENEKMPCLEIEDYPAYIYRGAHLDVSRHFFSVDEVKQYIRYIGLYKVNFFHFHITDDQGYRIKIDKYPLLTEIGAKRINKDGKPYGGYYEKSDIKEILDYASIFGIDVIPEIEMPGHAQSVIAAYPNLSCTPESKVVTWNDWGISEETFCAGKEETFTFLENVLKEVMEMFPTKYIHIGGDECPKSHWEKCPLCQKRMKEEGLSNAHELQAYFICRISKFIQANDRWIVGWDEILEGEVPAKKISINNGVVMYWRDGVDEGLGTLEKGKNLALETLNKGMFLVLCPVKHFYFNFAQEMWEHEKYKIPKDWDITLDKVLEFDPVNYIGQDRIKDKNFAGVQFNLWTERIENFEIAKHMLFPRISAFAEKSWVSNGNFSKDDFMKRYNKHQSYMKHIQKA